MKKTVLTALLALTITLVPGVALASQVPYPEDTVKLVGAAWDLPNNWAESRDSSNNVLYIDATGRYGTCDEPHYSSWIELAANDLAAGDNLIVAGLEHGSVSADDYQKIKDRANQINSNHKGSLARIGGTSRDETKLALTEYLDRLALYQTEDMAKTQQSPTGNTQQAATDNTQKTFVIGALYDVPIAYVPDAAISDPISRDKAIGETAKALASGKNIVVAGGPAGAVSDEMYKAIIEEAGKVNPNHGGSIIRIGGQDATETQSLMMWFLTSSRYF